MRIHKEGNTFVISSLAIFVIVLVITICCPTWYWYIATGVALLIALFMLNFFRFPNLALKQIGDGVILAPADGTIVVVDENFESEYFKDKRIQVSIFMSVSNVHINWIPLSGVVDYFRYHKGKYLIAKHPKSSELNERTTIVVNNGKIKVLFRQIAGYVARRIVCYVKEGDKVEQNQQCGFIKFGSRVDLFLPLGTEINVKMGQKVKATETIIARLKE